MNRRVDTRVQYPHYRQPSRTPPPPVAIPPLLGVLPPLVAALPPDATAAPCPVARPRAAPPPAAALSVTGSRRGTALGLVLALRAFTIVAAICVNLWRAVSSASQASRGSSSSVAHQGRMGRSPSRALRASSSSAPRCSFESTRSQGSIALSGPGPTI